MFQRQAWLKEALEAISSAPSETDLLKAALSVLKAHTVSPTEGCDIGEDTKNALVKAFDEVIYFVEDLDHAKGEVEVVSCVVNFSYCRFDNTGRITSNAVILQSF